MKILSFQLVAVVILELFFAVYATEVPDCIALGFKKKVLFPWSAIDAFVLHCPKNQLAVWRKCRLINETYLLMGDCQNSTWDNDIWFSLKLPAIQAQNRVFMVYAKLLSVHSGGGFLLGLMRDTNGVSKDLYFEAYNSTSVLERRNGEFPLAIGEMNVIYILFEESLINISERLREEYESATIFSLSANQLFRSVSE